MFKVSSIIQDLSLLKISNIYRPQVLPESPRWLLSRGKNEEAVKILRRAAKTNKVHFEDLPSNFRLEEEDRGLMEIFREFFHSKKLLFRWIIIVLNWFVILNIISLLLKFSDLTLESHKLFLNILEYYRHHYFNKVCYIIYILRIDFEYWEARRQFIHQFHGSGSGGIFGQPALFIDGQNRS